MTFQPNVEKTPTRNWLKHWWFWVVAVILVGIVAYHLMGRPEKTAEGTGKKGANLAAQKIPVATTAAKKGDMPIYPTGLGSVTPLRTVTVKTRVDGELMRVNYKEGQIVKQGDLLVEIDPRPYQAQLTQAEGQIIRDQALLKNAKMDRERYRVLSEQDSIAKQQYDTQKSLVNQLEGTVKFDQGQIDNAKLQLVYARITAPVSGRIGLALADPGNIVHATDTTGLAVITQIEPITVIFTIPEDNLPELLDKLRAQAHLPVDAFNRDKPRKLSSGYLLTLDNQIDPNSGTVRLRG